MKVKERIIKDAVSIKDSKDFVKNLLKTKLPVYIKFHDWSHTKSVLKETVRIAEASDCTEQEIEWLSLAALFHDTGYTKTYDGHEEASVEHAQVYLQKQGYPPVDIDQVTQLILSTKVDFEPQMKLEKILKDADMSHLGKKKYLKKVANLYEEINFAYDEKVLSAEWNKKNLAFINSHVYYTDEANGFYKKRKNKNRLKLQEQQKEIKQESSISENKAARMIFKTALRNHIDLTNIADQKANIMLTINAVILTLGMPLFSTFLMDRPTLRIPAILFLITCALTMILATLATRPVSTDGKTNVRKLFSGKTNLFFFGNFYNMPLKEYQASVNKVMSDPETLDQNIMNDLYYLGNALGSKYKMLRLCYTFFAGGLIVTFISFVVSYLIYG